MLSCRILEGIPCAGGDFVAAAREQGDVGANPLPLAPVQVGVYDRNTLIDQILEDAGIQLIKIKGSELVRGRGGPRCMSMALYRVTVS